MLDLQITDACGCHAVSGKGLLPLDDAVALSLQQVAPLTRHETLPLGAAIGRIATQRVLAPREMPYFDNSAMDGFALCCADLNSSDFLPIAGTVVAGDAPRDLPRGQALRIFTGAPLPKGADAVVMIEQCDETGTRVRFSTKPTPGMNIRRQGSDQQTGAVLLEPGTRIAAHHVGLLAANGIVQVKVSARPHVAVFSTGDELAPVAQRPLAAGQIPDANRPMLLAMAATAGAEVTDLGILPDRPAATRDALADLKDRFDLILTSGAVSMGGKDHIRTALVSAGGTIKGWKVAIKPGKPVMFGRLGRTAVTGLPGNPFAAFVGFHLFAGPQIAHLSGGRTPPFASQPARAGFDWSRKPGRAEVFPVRVLHHDANGCPVLHRLGDSVSATLFPLTAADGLACVPAETAHVAAGDQLTWQPFCINGERS